jgi:predicted GTPase
MAFSDSIQEFTGKRIEIKIALLGVRPAVGKSTLIQTFVN